MTSTDIDRMLTDVSEAACDISRSIPQQIERSEMLNRFWYLQDNLNRLVEAVSDNRDQAMPILKIRQTDLATGISDLLRVVTVSKTDTIAAVARSCRSISRSLLRIESTSSQISAPVLAHAATAGH